ncbi:MAG: deoxyhypusine synthase family protein, partial [Candidatus Bipolaricaulota bacterium]|nr:deoxyhypusine synthase family protein [Candidatus Bipolaricaulota bacterium]
PKNYSLQPEPYLSQICGLETEGYDCDVQICDAHVQNGGLSSCTAGEAHTWGKVSAEFQKNSQYVFAEVTSVFPFMVHALLQAGLRKKPRRLLDHRDEALSLLDRALKI